MLEPFKTFASFHISAWCQAKLMSQRNEKIRRCLWSTILKSTEALLLEWPFLSLKWFFGTSTCPIFGTDACVVPFDYMIWNWLSSAAINTNSEHYKFNVCRYLYDQAFSNPSLRWYSWNAFWVPFSKHASNSYKTTIGVQLCLELQVILKLQCLRTSIVSRNIHRQSRLRKSHL